METILLSHIIVAGVSILTSGYLLIASKIRSSRIHNILKLQALLTLLVLMSGTMLVVNGASIVRFCLEGVAISLVNVCVAGYAHYSSPMNFGKNS